MRLFYIDPGIRDNSGHHASWCRGIVGETRARGIETIVATYAGIAPGLRAEFDAAPVFRTFTHHATDGDPIAGWLNAYDTGAKTIAEDLDRLGPVGPDDLFLVMAGEAPQLKGLLVWLHRQPADRRPRVIFDIGQDPGFDVEIGPEGKIYRPRDPRVDPSAILFRFTARELAEIDLARFHLVTMGGASSDAFRILLKAPVGVLPMAQPKGALPVSRVGRRPVTIGCLGYQRTEKGYPLMPDIARLLLAAHADIRLLVHNSAPAETPLIQSALHEIAAVDPRLIVNETSVDGADWAALLARTDLMLCPYLPQRYTLRSSGICIEAIASGIPLVVPVGTYLERELREFGGGGATFTDATPELVVEAVRLALSSFDEIAASSFEAATRLHQIHGIPHFVDAVLDLDRP